jgi:hypothetical protein
MRNTRDGSLLIEMEKREKERQNQAAGPKTKKLDPSGMTVFHIRGMDELTTVDELEKALKDVTDQKETHLTSEKT